MTVSYTHLHYAVGIQQGSVAARPVGSGIGKRVAGAACCDGCGSTGAVACVVRYVDRDAMRTRRQRAGCDGQGGAAHFSRAVNRFPIHLDCNVGRTGGIFAILHRSGTADRGRRAGVHGQGGAVQLDRGGVRIGNRVVGGNDDLV